MKKSVIILLSWIYVLYLVNYNIYKVNNFIHEETGEDSMSIERWVLGTKKGVADNISFVCTMLSHGKLCGSEMPM
jgi:hypothetical protein